MSGTVSGASDTSVNKVDRGPCPPGVYFAAEETENKWQTSCTL